MFEPKIAAFLCNWCAYAGADLAGVSRIQYAQDVRVIHVMCSGRVDPIFPLKAFGVGIDGVLILGCHPGDCHYQTGNLQADKKMQMTRFILETIGVPKDRLRFDYVSAAEGGRFGEVVSEFIKEIKELGPIKKDKDLIRKITLGKKIVDNERLRWLIGKEYEITEKGNVYDEKVDSIEFKDMLSKNILDEFKKEQICSMIEKKAYSVKEISKNLELCPSEVFRYLTYMENSGLVVLDGHKDNYPTFLNAYEK